MESYFADDHAAFDHDRGVLLQYSLHLERDRFWCFPMVSFWVHCWSASCFCNSTESLGDNAEGTARAARSFDFVRERLVYAFGS